MVVGCIPGIKPNRLFLQPAPDREESDFHPLFNSDGELDVRLPISGLGVLGLRWAVGSVPCPCAMLCCARQQTGKVLCSPFGSP